MRLAIASFERLIVDREIICIMRNAPATDCTSITHVGVVDSDYMIPIKELIELIDRGQDRFFVIDKATKKAHYVEIAEKEGIRYIRTMAYDSLYDSLLKLWNCNQGKAPRGWLDPFGYG